MASVFGLRLSDGTEVAVKSRQDPTGRTTSCVAAQLHLADHDYPCARPLTPVTQVGDLAVNAEEWRPGGQMRRGDSAAEARLCAAAFARLTAELEGVRVAPPLPNPYWLDWDHGGPGLWPAKRFLEERDSSLVPDFVIDCVTRATARLRAADLPRCLGACRLRGSEPPLAWSRSVDGLRLGQPGVDAGGGPRRSRLRFVRQHRDSDPRTARQFSRLHRGLPVGPRAPVLAGGDRGRLGGQHLAGRSQRAR